MKQNNFLSIDLKFQKLHFIGIGGIGMSALARFCNAKGAIISGSDRESTSILEELQNISQHTNRIWVPHNKQKIKELNPDYIIYSTAIAKDNEELLWAKENKKDILHRSELLEIIVNSKKLIAVSGTHGKTTTSAIICEMLINNNFDPSAILGGILLSKNTNAVIGNKDYFVIEADESDKSLLRGNPEIGVITNIEADHLENFPGGLEEIKNTFLIFASKAFFKRGLVVCIQDKNINDLISSNFNLNDSKLISYGIHSQCDITKVKLLAKKNDNAKSWDIYYNNSLLNSITPKFPGECYVLNLLAAYGVGVLLELTPEVIKQSLENYSGTKRRFQILEKSADLTIIDDYAHHPTELKATMQAARELSTNRRLICVIQPHQAIRLRDLWNDFLQVLKTTEEEVFITDVYIARGGNIPGVTSLDLVKQVNKPNINYLCGGLENISSQISKVMRKGDLILIMGAGDITKIGPMIIKSRDILLSKTGNNKL